MLCTAALAILLFSYRIYRWSFVSSLLLSLKFGNGNTEQGAADPVFHFLLPQGGRTGQWRCKMLGAIRFIFVFEILQGGIAADPVSHFLPTQGGEDNEGEGGHSQCAHSFL